MLIIYAHDLKIKNYITTAENKNENYGQKTGMQRKIITNFNYYLGSVQLCYCYICTAATINKNVLIDFYSVLKRAQLFALKILYLLRLYLARENIVKRV